jgi:hypothetical protein
MECRNKGRFSSELIRILFFAYLNNRQHEKKRWFLSGFIYFDPNIFMLFGLFPEIAPGG